jgi:hypothetical protein
MTTACLMAGGKLTVRTAQMNVQDPPCTSAGPPKFCGLFQSSNGVNHDDSSVRKAAGDLSHRVDDPVSALKCVTEPTSLKLAAVKTAASCG